MTTAPRRQKRPNPFKVLGVSPMATQSEITTAYRALAKQFHPDRFQEQPEIERRAAETRMAELNEAYKMAKEQIRYGTDDDIYGTGSRARGRNEPWSGADVGAWSRTAKRSESSAARAARMAMAREVAERAARAHETQARVFQRQRVQARKDARFGDAVARSKTGLPSTLAGAGQAVHTNELACRRCRTIMRLPAGWHDRLDTTAFFCSSCNELLLSR